ncbi:Clp protease N-terminal domain-containing protein [Amycolatopsis palatopharyngis]|uniref:Clp protease N-terminal domain-containing protein n=1 Tax=Amycolatopsis palatopharyngis TaxID=187982 RepID=UPI000E24EC11|nr:Clp protease N-terminal domain-containing protein [Amycolatopsis palatopharyngis]
MAEAKKPDVDHYVGLVEERAGAGDPLTAVGIASAVRRELEDVADQVMEHFVRAARHAGHSWTEIGDRLGVSKQAARQQFGGQPLVPVSDELVVMIRLQACLDQARAAAHRDGSAEADTHHLLLGLLHVGIAATVLDKIGLTGERVRQSISHLFGTADTTQGGEPPTWSADADQAIAAATTLARDRDFEYVGTEHLLHVLATDPGSQASRVLQDLGVDPADIVHELERKITLRPTRSRRRRRRHDTEPKCSFCRKTKPGVRKVAGPNVCICEDCLHLAHDALAGGDSPRTR